MTNQTPISSQESEVSAVSNDERTWATITHLSALAGVIFPLLALIAPLIIWLVKKNELPFVNEQGKEAINFQITILIGFVICIPLMAILIGFVLAFILGVVDLILIIVAAVSANKGEHYRYPFVWRVVK